MTLEPVRVMGAGVVVILYVDKVMSQKYAYIHRLQKNLKIERTDAVVHEWINISMQIHSKFKYR